MNQEKMGKLIRELRQKQGLTQTELGDKFGVGYRAVSKWERGINCPDIAIINELSEILGITSDELLRGELNEPIDNTEDNIDIPEPKEKHFHKLYLIIPGLFILTIITILGIIIYHNHYKEYVYYAKSINREICGIEGKVTIKGNELSIFINKLEFEDAKLNKTLIKNYSYEIVYDENVISRYAKVVKDTSLADVNTIKQFTDNFTVNYISKSQYNLKSSSNKVVTIKFTFLTTNDEEIMVDAPFELVKTE